MTSMQTHIRATEANSHGVVLRPGSISTAAGMEQRGTGVALRCVETRAIVACRRSSSHVPTLRSPGHPAPGSPPNHAHSQLQCTI
jgi:hypothetical protein